MVGEEGEIGFEDRSPDERSKDEDAGLCEDCCSVSSVWCPKADLY